MFYDLRAAARAMTRVSVFIGHASAILILASILLSVFEALMRYGFNAPTQWTYEVVIVLCATNWCLAVGYVTARDRHITINILEMLIPPRIWRYFTLAALLLSTLAMLGLIWAVWEPVMLALRSPERSGSSFNPLLPSFLKVMLLTGAVLYLLQLFANIVRWAAPTSSPEQGESR